MRRVDTESNGSGHQLGGGGTVELSVPQLAHELNSLLDGAMRWAALSRGLLAGPAPDHAAVKTAVEHLARADAAMRQMAAVVARAMDGHRTAGLLRDAADIRTAIPRIVSRSMAVADAHGVRISYTVDEAVASLPIGVAETIICNAVRNGVEAASRASTDERRVEVSVVAGADETVEIAIRDTGPGLPDPEADDATRGHGIGLDLCRQLADQLGGTIELQNVPYGPGAVFTARVPVRRLETPPDA